MTTTSALSMSISDATMTKVSATCERCQVPFMACSIFGGMIQRVCDTCVARFRDEEAKRVAAKNKAARRLAKWCEMCPPEYRLLADGGKTDPERLLKAQPSVSRILQTPYSDRGVLIRGESDVCKTRCIWALLKVYWDTGRSVVAFTAGEFERVFRDASGEFKLSDRFKEWSTVDCLFIDDLGKSRWTENTLQTFFDLVEHRTSHCKPMFITTNYAREQLVSKFSIGADMADPLMRRLVENCDLYLFRK